MAQTSSGGLDDLCVGNWLLGGSEKRLMMGVDQEIWTNHEIVFTLGVKSVPWPPREQLNQTHLSNWIIRGGEPESVWG